MAPKVAETTEEAQIHNPSPSSQLEQAKEPEAPKVTSSDKAVEVPKDGTASQSFEQALALTTFPTGGDSKEKIRRFLLKQLTKPRRPSSKKS